MAEVGRKSTATLDSGPRSSSKFTFIAPLLLTLSVAVWLACTYLVPNEYLLVDGDWPSTKFLDLHVYVDGAASIGTGHALYDFAYHDPIQAEPQPFTYPPFAAIVFYPLHLLPFGLVAFAWIVGTIAALYGVVRISQRLLGRGSRGAAMCWTAVGIWTEPLRSTLHYGQINVVLCLAVLYAVYSTRWWLSGLLVGLAAGVKLTPAISGLYFVAVKRWVTVLFAAVVFIGTVAVSVLVVGDQGRHYFTDLIGDAERVGWVPSSFNQSWRGTISRAVGHDVGYSLPVLIAIAVTAALALLAWRAIGARAAEKPDRLGGIVIVELFGLLLSPISWTHHWVWLVPAMIWLIHGPLRDRRGAHILGWGWLALTLIGPPWLLSFVEPTLMESGRPVEYRAYLACSVIYIVAALTTLVWVAGTGRRPHRDVWRHRKILLHNRAAGD